MVVVDTSVVFKWLREENDRHLSLKILNDFLDKKLELIAPNIILYELANVLSFKKELTSEIAIEAWDLFVDFNLRVYVPNPNFLAKCIEFSKQYNVSIYDASYAVLARDNKCDFVTAD